MDWIVFDGETPMTVGNFYLITHNVDGKPVVNEALYHDEYFVLFPNSRKIPKNEVTAVIHWPEPYVKGKHER